LAAGLSLAARSRAEAEAAATALSALSATFTEGKPAKAVATEAMPPELRTALTELTKAGEEWGRYLGCVNGFVLGLVEGKIAAPGKGAFRGELARTLTAIDVIVPQTQLRNADVTALVEACTAGDFSKRADTSKYVGYNGKLVTALNTLLESCQAPVRDATAALERLAKRDLTARMGGKHPGEWARLATALNGTAQELHDALAHVSASVGQVSSAAGEIASSSQQVASGASEQASSLEETASSLESMASMVKSSADNAQQASALAQSAKGVAADGVDAMQQMAGAMESIRASAEGTSQIIKDINEIAFQTNLLALNAAVEAARAGDAGRGFAVVAEEVRSLALRSKEAANKTEALIRESVRQTGEGDATAKLVAGKLTEITGIVGKVSDIVGEIAAASREQATGIDQVTSAVGEMNKVTQQNAANSEQSSSAAVELSSQSEELASVLGNFKLAASASAAPVTARAAKLSSPVSPRDRGAAARPPLPRAKAAAAGAVAAKPKSKPQAPRKANGATVSHGNGIAIAPADLIPL
ncbi:MAG TPA: methyl-accepting chemotaxis protein, partial [Anaeromyxobacteraceae bacterium]